MGIPNQDPRQTRRFEIAATAPVARFGKAWLVASQSGGKPYVVALKGDALTCTCPDHQHRGSQCKHIHAAAFAALGVSARTGTEH